MLHMLWFAMALALFPPLAWSATYFLNPATGSDGAAGTMGAPWKTIFKAKTTVNAGDTVNILAGSYTQSQIQGEVGTPSWTEAHRLGTAGNPITIQANPGDTVTINGQGQYYFQYFFNATVGYPGHYVVVRGLNLVNYTGLVIAVGSNAFDRPAHHVAVLDCTFDGIENGQGAGLSPGPAQYVIFKGNRVLNSGTASGGDGFFSSQHSIYLSDQTEYTVIDGNHAETTSGYNIHGWNSHGFANTSRNVIIRRNTLVNAHGSNVIISGQTYANIYMYNNTLFNDPTPFPGLSGPGDSALSFHNNASYSNVQVKNNIGYGHYGFGTVWQPYAEAGFTSVVLNYNSWTNLLVPSEVYRWQGTFFTLAGLQAAEGREGNSVTGNPQFTNAAGRNFTLQAGSNAIDAGTTLTTAAGSGSNSTALTVADAGYFHDGYGLIEGDTIRIGAATAVVTAVNYGTNVLTLAAPRSWSNGAAVSLDYQGSAPDMGALETSGSTVATALAFGQQPSDTQTASVFTPALTVQVVDQFGALFTSSTASIALAIGTNPAGGTLTGTVTQAAVGGIATFANLAINNVGGGYTLVATSTGLTSATSNPFTISEVPPPAQHQLSAPRVSTGLFLSR